MNFDAGTVNNDVIGDFNISGSLTNSTTILKNQSKPSNPPTDNIKLYSDTNDNLHILTDNGVDKTLNTGSSGNVVTGIPTDNEIARFDTNGNTIQGSNVSITDNTHIQITNSSSTIAIGSDSFNNVDITKSMNNTAVGHHSMQTGTIQLTGGYNVGVGDFTLRSIRGVANCNTAVGYNAGDDILTGSQNTCIGCEAGTSGLLDNQTSIGFGATCDAANQITLGNSGVTVMRPGGDNVMDLGTSGRRFKDVYLGGTVDAAAYTVSGASTKPVIPFGTQSYGIGNSTATSGNFSVYIGDFAGETNTGGTNIAIGNAALRESTSSERNVAIGDSALRGVVGSELTGTRHVAIGQDALRNVKTVSEHNTAVGWSSGLNVSTGSGNVCMGYLSGDSITTGVSNTCIGYAADCAESGSNQTAIGNNAICNASNQITLGDVLVEVVRPGGDNKMDLGASGRRFKDAYLSGTVIAGQLDLGKVIYVKNDTEAGSGFVGNTHAVINRAITALSGVGHIILGAGTYTFGAAVNLNNSSWDLHISGTSGTIISNSTTDAFVLTSGFTPKVRFSELEFQTASSNNSTCITNDGTGSELYMDNCKFTATSAATSVQFSPLFIKDNSVTDPQGVTNISDCEFNLSAVLAAACGVLGANGRGKNHKWSKCVFIGTQSYDTILFDCTSLTASDLSVSDCYFQDGIINWRNGAFTRFNNCTYVDTFITSRLNPGGTTDRYMLLNNCRFFMNTRSHPIVLFDGTEWTGTGARQAYMKFNACEFTPASGQPVFSLVRPGPAGNNFTLYLEVKNTLYGLPTLNVYDLGGSSTVTQASDNFVEYPKLDGVTVTTAYTSNVPLGARAYDTTRGWMKNTSSTPASPTWTPEITIIDGSSATLSGTVDAGSYTVGGTTTYPIREVGTSSYTAGTNVKTSGNFSVVIGENTGSSSTGNQVTAMGVGSISNVSTCSNIVALGNASLQSVGGAPLTGGNHTAIGAGALKITQGAAANNTAIGYQAGDGMTTGSQNTFLGAGTDGVAEGKNQTAIGYQALCTADNQVVLGNSSVTEVRTGGAVTVGSFATGSLPSGTNGMIAYDSTTNQLKAYVNGAWTVVV